MRKLVAAANQPPARRGSKRRRNRRGRAAGNTPLRTGLANDDVRVEKYELVEVIKVTKGSTTAKGSVEIRPSKLPWLSALGKAFQRYKFLSLVVEYRPACAVTQAGMVTIGFDWDWLSDDGDRKKVAGLNPTATGPVFNPLRYQLPPSRIMTRAWYQESTTADYFDYGPGKAAYAVDAATKDDLVVGELWVKYVVVFNGTVIP